MASNGLRRRVLVAGSAAPDVDPERLAFAHSLLRSLIPELVRQGATFVVPIDAEPRLDGGSGPPIVFDWTVLEAVWAARSKRPLASGPEPFIVAVSHTKGLRHIPDDRRALWEDVRTSPDVDLVSLGEMNSGALRRQGQASHAQVLVILGGSEGVLHLGDLVHGGGHPVVPLNMDLGRPETGAELLSRHAATRPADFFRARGVSEGGLLDSVDLSRATDPVASASAVRILLEHLAPPRAFAVRLLNSDHPDFNDVERYFAEVVTPVAEESGYDVVTAGRGRPEHALLDQEIFELLHRADLVLADLTGERPNCYLELGYALGRSLPALVLARAETTIAFDTRTLPIHFWSLAGGAARSQADLRGHWQTQAHRPPIVQAKSLL